LGMQGKLYPDSTSIYEDEAKLLYDYFSKATTTIIEKEDASNKEISKWKECLANGEKDARKLRFCWIPLLVLTFAVSIAVFVYWQTHDAPFSNVLLFFGPVLFLVFMIVFLVNNAVHKKKMQQWNVNLQDAESGFKSIRRDYHVTKMGIAYVPVAQRIPFEGKSITVDLSGSVPEADFSLQNLKDPDRFVKDIVQLKEELASVPVVEGDERSSTLDTSDNSISMQDVPLHDYSTKLNDSIQNVTEDLSTINTMKVSIPVVSSNSNYMEYLKMCGTETPEEYPVLNVFDVSSLKPRLEVFTSLYHNQESGDNLAATGTIEDLMQFLGESTDVLFQNKMHCCSSVLEYNGNIFANVLKSPYKNYSPQLEAETIADVKTMNFNFTDMAESYKPFKLKESSLMKFDLYSNSWIDETGAHTSTPFGLHQIQAEIFMPLVENLMEENKIERRKIYDKIEEQKRKYVTDWHTATQDFYGRNRDTADDLKGKIIESLGRYNAAYANWKAINDTIKTMDKQKTLDSGVTKSVEGIESSTIIAADKINAQFDQQQVDFDSYMDRLQDDIDTKADSFAHVTFYEAYLYAEEAKKVADATSEVTSLDERQQRLLKVSPYLAKYGVLPPRPTVEQDVYDSMQVNLKEEALRLSEQVEEPVATDDGRPAEEDAGTPQEQKSSEGAQEEEGKVPTEQQQQEPKPSDSGESESEGDGSQQADPFDKEQH
jgi:hypothetical protein